MMAEDNWAKLLATIYSNDPYHIEESAQLRGESGLEDITTALSFLKRHQLIEEQDDHYVLTEKGFDVAREREMQLSQLETNMHVAVFTFILSIAIVFQMVAQLSAFGQLGWTINGIVLALVIILLALLERRTELFRMVVRGR